MLKNFRLIAMVLVFAASSFETIAQINETDNYKDVLLDGKPAKLNLVTGEITFTNGEIAKSRAARKIKDSVLDNRTEIKTNLLKDMSATTNATQHVVITDAIEPVVDDTEIDTDSKTPELIENPTEANDYKTTMTLLTNETVVSNPSITNREEHAKNNPYDFHMVKKGETLYQLAQRYETSLGQLKIANNLETTLIKEGETLRVRNFESVEATDSLWIVSKGDTLYNIAKRNNTTVEEIKDLNALSNNLIKIGQKLQVNQNSAITKK